MILCLPLRDVSFLMPCGYMLHVFTEESTAAVPEKPFVPDPHRKWMLFGGYAVFFVRYCIATFISPFFLAVSQDAASTGNRRKPRVARVAVSPVYVARICAREHR